MSAPTIPTQRVNGLTPGDVHDEGHERGSAYPPAIADVMPRARRIAAELGQRPSRRRLMRDLRIGGPKADAVLAQLDTTTPTTAATPTAVAPTTDVPEVDQASAEDSAGRIEPTDPTTVAVTVGQDDRDECDGPTPAVSTARPEVAAVAVPSRSRRVRSWPVWLLALPAFVAIWSGWVGLGELTGFGVVHPLPGIADGLAINTAITLPIGMEAYAAFALRVWLSGSTPLRARRFARTSAVGALVLGALGQVAYHLMSAAGMQAAPWPITAVVACLPVAVLGMGAALAHLLTDHHDTTDHNDSADDERGEAQR